MWSLDNLNGDFAAGSVEIREVWDSNLEDEISLIRSIMADFPFVSMDTEFPGLPIVPVSTSQTSLAEFNYQTLLVNINILKLIQLGLTFFDSSGHLPLFGSPPRPCIWQFNFREFDPARDFCNSTSKEHLRCSGIDLEKNHRLGASVYRFSEFFSFGVLQNDSLQWITFHSCYDLGYLLKALTCRKIPISREDFYRSLRQYFPKVFDIKHLMISCNLNGGLNKVAEDLGMTRVGIHHQVGSDSLLTAAIFKKLKDRFFHGSVERFAGVLHGVD